MTAIHIGDPSSFCSQFGLHRNSLNETAKSVSKIGLHPALITEFLRTNSHKKLKKSRKFGLFHAKASRN